MPTPTQTRVIKISVDTKGDRNLKEIADKMGGLNRNVRSLSGSMNLLKNVFGAYLGALGIREIASMSDTMQLLHDRIKVLAGGTSQADAAMAGLLERANRTKTSIDGLADIYARLTASTKETGISTQTLLDLTEVLQNTFRIAGSGMQEANSAAIQLSQGFASGQLRGQELRSVLEANVVIGDILAKTFNVTRGELYKMAEAGNLTASKVMVALLNNMESVNGQAAQLGTTFEGSVTIAMNNFKVAINDLNESMGLSSGFGKALEVISEKFTLFGVLALALAAAQLPALIAALKATEISFYSAGVAAGVFVRSNFLTIALTAIAVAILLIVDNLDTLIKGLKKVYAYFIDFAAGVLESLRKLDEYFLKGPNRQAILNAQQKNIDELRAKARGLREEVNGSIVDAKRADDQMMSAASARARDLEKLKNIKPKGKEDKLKEILGRLNMEFKNGKISAQEYYRQLDAFEKLKLDRSFRDGKIQLDKYNEGLEELKRKQIAREFSQGKLSIQEFNRQIEANKVAELDAKFGSGLITLREYDEELVKISTKMNAGSNIRMALYDFIESAGTLGTAIAASIKGTFSILEDSFMSFIKTGKFEFEKFTQAVLDDLMRIIIRSQIIAPLAQGLLNYMSPVGASGATTTAGGSYTNYSGTAAKGMSFENGMRKFAKGGLVNSPTMFRYNKGQTGLMGEAGTEAILPLGRSSNGDLGVQASVTPVTINVINQNGSDVEQRESTGPNGERTVEMIIKNKVRQGIADGSFDKALGQTYGLSRKGV